MRVQLARVSLCVILSAQMALITVQGRPTHPQQEIPEPARQQAPRTHHGMDPETARVLKERVQEYKVLAARKLGREINKEEQDEFLGDILPTLEQIEAMIAQLLQEEQVHGSRQTHSLVYAWPLYSSIRYSFFGHHDKVEREIIRQALDIWEEMTCLSFVEVDDSYPGHYILFAKGDGCWSYVGNVGLAFSPQPIMLGRGCFSSIGIPLHEIAHALGVFHEHTRPDRDTYVEVLSDNIQDGTEVNFGISSGNTYDIPYDHRSVMHYGRFDFSNVSPKVETIIPKDGKYNNTMGQRERLSFRDVKLIQRHYGCDALYENNCGISSSVCPGEAYLDRDCTCRCPDGFGGDLCDRVADSDPGCGDQGTTPYVATDQETCFEVPSSGNITIGTECNWWIQASSGQTIDYYFTDMFLASSDAPDNTCVVWVDIRDRDTDNYQRFCGIDPTPTMTSETNEIVVMMRRNYRELAGYVTRFRLCFRLSRPQLRTLPPGSGRRPVPATRAPGLRPAVVVPPL